LFDIAGYTYGPLLGLFAFGILTQRQLKSKFLPIILLLSPLLSFLLDKNGTDWLSGYKFGFELLILNGAFTFLGLCIISNPKTSDI
jgi:SSS family solute:Na+ symporter